MGDSLQKKSCRILLEHLKLNGHPIRSGFPPPLTFHDHNGKKNSILGYEFVCSIQILNRHGSHVHNLYRTNKLVSEKVVITAFKMHKKVAVGSFFIGWYPSYNVTLLVNSLGLDITLLSRMLCILLLVN